MDWDLRQKQTQSPNNRSAMGQYIYALSEGRQELDKRALDIYNSFAKMPIIDIHTHYGVSQIRSNNQWYTPTDFFLGTVPKCLELWHDDYGFDHYVAQRMMRANVSQTVIFGDLKGYNEEQKGAGRQELSYDEFQKLRFSEMVRSLRAATGDTVEFWFRTELKNIFGLEYSPSTEPMALWDQISEKLPNITPQSLLEQNKVHVACTTDDPTDDVSLHSQQGGPKLLPTFRPDRALMIGREMEDPTKPELATTRYHFTSWIKSLEAASNIAIHNIDDLEQALRSRLKYFKQNGCVAADLGITNFKDVPCTKEEATAILKKKMGGNSLTDAEVDQWQSYMLYRLLALNGEFGLRQFIHQGARRDINEQLFRKYGADVGGDGQGEALNFEAMISIFNKLKQEIRTGEATPFGGLLAPTVIFPINQGDYEKCMNNITSLAVGIKNVSTSPIQVGPPWWFADNEHDVREMIKLQLRNGTLSQWVGMLSDARSLGTVVARFDWFRALLAFELASAQTLSHLSPAQITGIYGGACYRNGNTFLGLTPNAM